MVQAVCLKRLLPTSTCNSCDSSAPTIDFPKNIITAGGRRNRECHAAGAGRELFSEFRGGRSPTEAASKAGQLLEQGTREADEGLKDRNGLADSDQPWLGSNKRHKFAHLGSFIQTSQGHALGIEV